MCIEGVEKQDGQTIFRIKEAYPYGQPCLREIVVQHNPGPFSSYPTLPTKPLASSIKSIFVHYFKVLGWDCLAFQTSIWPDGSDTTEGPFSIPKATSNPNIS